MKRNKSKEYAEAFLSAAKGKNTAEQKHLIHVLVQVVIRRGEQKLLPHIRREIILSLEKEGKRVAVHVEVSTKTQAEKEKEGIRQARTLLGAKDIPESVSVNPSIVGGFRVRYRDTVYDASYRTHLLDLYSRLVS